MNHFQFAMLNNQSFFYIIRRNFAESFSFIKTTYLVNANAVFCTVYTLIQFMFQFGQLHFSK